MTPDQRLKTQNPRAVWRRAGGPCRRLDKTVRRTTRFLAAALAFRAPERQLGPVAWSLVGGAIACAVVLPTTPAALPDLMAALYLIMLLAPVCAIDARYGIIPDVFVIALALGGLCLTERSDLPAAILGATGVLLAGWLLHHAYRLVRGFDGLGLGDVKFLGACSLWVGLDGVPAVLLVGVGSALVTLCFIRMTGKSLSRHDAVPFGPHLAAGLWLTWLFRLFQL